MNSRRPLYTTSLLAAFVALSALATAQGCGVRNSYRIVNSFGTATSELIVDTGWVTNAPLMTPGSNNNPGVNCFSQGTCNPIADYGYLHCSGTGSASNCATNGVFLILDSGPQARFMDTLTVVSGTLPPGSPVQVQLVVTLVGHATMIDPIPYVDYGVTVTAGPIGMTIANGSGTSAPVFNTSVGTPTQLLAGLNITLGANGLLGLGNPPLADSYDVDLTVHIGAICLTPGASLQSCSGHNYAPLASVGPVAGGCGANSPLMTATLPVLGQTQNYTITAAPANEPVFFAFAPGNPVHVPLGQCVITEDPSAVALLFVGASNAAGDGGFSLSIPNSPGLIGLAFTGQAMVLSPGGPLLGIAELSNGLFVTVGL